LRTILFIDDSSIMRASIPPTLRKQDFEVIEACDGVDALEKLNSGLKPDIIITDLNMPNMDGLTFVKEARKMRTLRFVPIYVLTTEKKQEKQDEVRAAGATGWFTKANFRDELFEVLKKVCVPTGAYTCRA